MVVIDGGPGIRKDRRELLGLFVFQFLLFDVENIGGLRARLGDEWFMFVHLCMFVVCRSAGEETKHGQDWVDDDEDGRNANDDEEDERA